MHLVGHHSQLIMSLSHQDPKEELIMSLSHQEAEEEEELMNHEPEVLVEPEVPVVIMSLDHQEPEEEEGEGEGEGVRKRWRKKAIRTN